VLTPAEAIAHVRRRVAEMPVELYTMMLSPPGIDMKIVRESIELFAKKVMPEFK
jgi:hypothetical protein